METSSENMNTQNNETLSFSEKRERDKRSQYTLNGIVLFLTENLGRVIGILTRESERLLSKVRQDIVSGTKEAGKKAGSDKTKASKDRVEDISVGSADEAIISSPVNKEAMQEEAKETQSDSGEQEEEKESQETNTEHDASSEMQATKTRTKAQRSKSQDEDTASDGGEESSSSDQEE